jgi:hypothetical protein
MKSIIIVSIVFAGSIWAADEVADRAAIENTIRVLSVSPTHAGLFTSDFDDEELARFGKAPAVDGAIQIKVEGAPGTLVISKEPMGEADWFPAGMHGSIAIKKIRFLTPDVAMVDAVGRTSVLIVLKKIGTDWKIASLRILAEKTS